MNAEAKLQAYARLLEDYARAANLVSPKVLAELPRHFEAARAYGEVLPEGAHVLDVGSGAGLPAIPLAILRPDLQLTLVERRAKRAAFLDLAVARLGLENVRVYNGDVQQWTGRTAFVTAQAVAPFDEVYRLVAHAAEYPLTLIARKGPGWRAEAERLGAEVFHVKRLGPEAELVALRVWEPR
ncbi:MAG TPA: 16S rRNA (guanine(527)-N(7))-methyltransferase RsmG [Oceanithermus profundus]|uniref:Ribosomal RNA small subunit methyltransferase G n=1 Tax=Oceanithermus profundus TaxID=187137 RepID=A0A7C4VH45_9DEIN|nr:16S rRNA (guanine(527)-N(7))-methyltransferase RsmG [Oceanithermus profundus]